MQRKKADSIPAQEINFYPWFICYTTEYVSRLSNIL
jgi:hypothetical protein